jgi:hypothetical protein
MRARSPGARLKIPAVKFDSYPIPIRNWELGLRRRNFFAPSALAYVFLTRYSGRRRVLGRRYFPQQKSQAAVTKSRSSCVFAL